MRSTARPCPRPLLVQTLIFPKGYFEPWDVFSWLSENGFRHDQVEETRQSFRARQYDPADFEQGSFRTISMGKGKSLVRAVTGCPSARLFARVERQRHGLRKAIYRPPPSLRKRRS